MSTHKLNGTNIKTVRTKLSSKFLNVKIILRITIWHLHKYFMKITKAR